MIPLAGPRCKRTGDGTGDSSPSLFPVAFALRRAALAPERFRRILVVISYLSILKQNAPVYSEIFGADAVLEHHSGSLMPLRERRRTESNEGRTVLGCSSTREMPDDSNDTDCQRYLTQR